MVGIEGPGDAAQERLEPDHGELRARILLQDEENSWGRLDAWQTNMTRGDIKSMKNAIDWYVKQFTEERFEVIKDDKPSVEEKKFGGREYTVIRAVGGQLFEVEVLALRQAHHDQVEAVDREDRTGDSRIPRQNLERHRVGGDGGHLALMEELGRPEADAREPRHR